MAWSLPDETPSYRSSPIYPSHLDALDWDYVALGHIHRHMVIRESPSLVAYSGATAESLEGDPAVLLVYLDPVSGVSLSLRELEPNEIQGLPTPGTATSVA